MKINKLTPEMHALAMQVKNKWISLAHNGGIYNEDGIGDPERADDIAKYIIKKKSGSGVFGKKKGENFTRYGANTDYGSVQVDLFNKSDSEITDYNNDIPEL